MSLDVRKAVFKNIGAALKNFKLYPVENMMTGNVQSEPGFIEKKTLVCPTGHVFNYNFHTLFEFSIHFDELELTGNILVPCIQKDTYSCL